ncbi:MAG TPA: hypothetical protein VLE93_02510 [Candidatus Saccharimonadales bacterium]|nr:hypothetical protein [Candidatus Saccharimonadales bacterium]
MNISKTALRSIGLKLASDVKKQIEFGFRLVNGETPAEDPPSLMFFEDLANLGEIILLHANSQMAFNLGGKWAEKAEPLIFWAEDMDRLRELYAEVILYFTVTHCHAFARATAFVFSKLA